ncbi:MAG: sigma 54-interacting transcriptional regulator [Nevskia sp.]|nr:sigma 54-interacting transcriptional regulator [Nevskia sp.]
MFRIGSRATPPAPFSGPPPYLTVVGHDLLRSEGEGLDLLQKLVPDGRRFEFVTLPQRAANLPPDGEFVLSLFADPSQLDGVADQVLAARAAGRRTVLIVAIHASQLVALGRWLDRRAAEGVLGGVRLMVAGDVASVATQLPQRLLPVTEDNVIRMPRAPEVEGSGFNNFYVFSPELQALVARVRGFARNGVTRAILLGGPGSGKTSIAYYYYQVRGLGQFVALNLAAENVGDKTSMKSLLCGHVSGAFPGAGARNGAITQAQDGVCFLDESHEITGAVMEVLMEVLDNGQYMPFGASSKRIMECALLYGTNRSWNFLQNSVNLDQFTRMGASRLEVPELHRREEDMIAVTAATLARLAAPCADWRAPTGVSPDGWNLLRGCRWRGNVRGLIRVLEAAFVDTASAGSDEHLIQASEISRGMSLWEPETHHSHQIYSVAS